MVAAGFYCLWCWCDSDGGWQHHLEFRFHYRDLRLIPSYWASAQVTKLVCTMNNNRTRAFLIFIHFLTIITKSHNFSSHFKNNTKVQLHTSNANMTWQNLTKVNIYKLTLAFHIIVYFLYYMVLQNFKTVKSNAYLYYKLHVIVSDTLMIDSVSCWLTAW